MSSTSGTKRLPEQLGNTQKHYFVRTGGFVNEYPRRDTEGQLNAIGDGDNPNHLLGCFPMLFPYGEGGFETNRKHNVSYEAHSRWALRYADRRFRHDLQFIFQVFSVQQKRAICASAGFRMKRADYVKHRSAMENLTPADFKKASEEENRKKPFSNPVIRALVTHLSAVRSTVPGSNQNRVSVRSQVWSLCTVVNPPSLWITINPSDVQNPIAQVFAGEDIDLDRFNRECGPNSMRRALNIAKDPYAAALFFHFVVKATLECLFGIKAGVHRIHRTCGIFGSVKAYIGMVE
ncbi:hypothetical protein F5880DRAFT_1491409, partial [Lentinula raphanica]